MKISDLEQKPKFLQQWQRELFIHLALLSYFLILIKWSFYVTDMSISFMYPLTIWKKIEILLANGLALSLLTCFFQIIVSLLGDCLKPLIKQSYLYFVFLPRSILETLIAMIVVDNFTYTVFHFGILTVSETVMPIYTILFIGTFFLLIRLHSKQFNSPERVSRTREWSSPLFRVVLGISVLVVGISYFTSPTKIVEAKADEKAKISSSFPNIIILGSDGINAKNMSVYGYDKETTPFLDSWVQDCLLSENNFSNANKSLGSDTSLLTGKSPLSTRVIFSPDILRGVDIEEHLPGLLKQFGYTTMQQGFPYYVDSGVANLENGFDEINYVPQTQLAYALNRFFNYRLTDEVYLISSIAETVATKIETIFFIYEAQNPYDEIIDYEQYSSSDKAKLASLYTALDQAKASGRPLFAHFHLMITHGGDFYTENHVFSKGETQDKQWMEDFYDDAILDYDGYVRDLVAYLKKIGEYDNTIIVLYTDHTQQWNTNGRIPLIFHFPNDEHAGVLTTNSQNMDIAPTLLDSLGIKIPAWMEGGSLLEPIAKDRLIVSAKSKTITLAEKNGRSMTAGWIRIFINSPVLMRSNARMFTA